MYLIFAGRRRNYLDRDQIVKALECGGTCRSCPYNKVVGCIRKREAAALALIRELIEENERLKQQRYIAYPDGRIELIPTVASVRADTVRKMKERLKEHLERPEFPCDSFTVTEEDIDRVASEMLEEDQ